MVTGFVSVLDGSGLYHLHCEMNDDIRKRTQVICRHLGLKMGITKMVSCILVSRLGCLESESNYMTCINKVSYPPFGTYELPLRFHHD